MNKYLSRITSSARGEVFNPLLWPFLFVTFAYGIAFTLVIPFSNAAGTSIMYSAMTIIHVGFPFIWGILALIVIVMGLTFLMFNIPPVGKASGLAGFALWAFATICYALTGNWLVLFAIALPNMYFWFWQYISLSKFRQEDANDVNTLDNYEAGRYDDEANPKDAKTAREDNRGAPEQ